MLEKIMELREEGLSNGQIAAKIGCSIQNVIYHLKKNGIPRDRRMPKKQLF